MLTEHFSKKWEIRTERGTEETYFGALPYMPLNWNPILELAINEPEMKFKQGSSKPKAVP